MAGSKRIPMGLWSEEKIDCVLIKYCTNNMYISNHIRRYMAYCFCALNLFNLGSKCLQTNATEKSVVDVLSLYYRNGIQVFRILVI